MQWRTTCLYETLIIVSGPRYESRTSILWSTNTKQYNSPFDSTLSEHSYCIEATTQSRFSFWLQHCTTCTFIRFHSVWSHSRYDNSAINTSFISLDKIKAAKVYWLTAKFWPVQYKAKLAEEHTLYGRWQGEGICFVSSFNSVSLLL
jgi:hypothetical protein